MNVAFSTTGPTAHTGLDPTSASENPAAQILSHPTAFSDLVSFPLKQVQLSSICQVSKLIETNFLKSQSTNEVGGKQIFAVFFSLS